MARRARDDEELVAAIEAITGHRLQETELLAAALTHASARQASAVDYQRLEFLGDRVLGLLVAEMLYAEHPDATEGELSLRLNALVNAETLAAIADETGISGLIRSSGEVRAARKQVNMRADVLEALIAVLYLDKGLEATREFIARYWRPRSRSEGAARRDAKTALQEWAHRALEASPRYSIEAREGPDHDPVFTVAVRIDGLEPAHGRGRSKREAEQVAAASLLRREAVWPEEETSHED